MESAINLQNELQSRMCKAYANFKKSPKDRVTREYCEARLEVLEQTWTEFTAGHRDLVLGLEPEKLNKTVYYQKAVYDNTEEVFFDYKCALKQAIAGFGKSEHSAAATPTSRNLPKLTKLNIPKFSGKYNEWLSFRDLFESLIHNNHNLQDVEKLHYLKGQLSGEADQLLRQIPISGVNYQRCWMLLEERYNNKRYLCHHILHKLLTQRQLTSESAQQLKELLDTTADCLASLGNIGVEVTTWDVLIIHIISLKLDPESRRQWEFHVNSTSSFDTLPTLKQFEEFLINRYRAIEFLGTGSKFSSKRVTNQREVKNVLHTAAVECPLCTEEHKLATCPDFAKKTVEDRRKFVLSNNVCFTCMGSNHSSKKCRTNLRCKICKRNHHSLLHPTGSQSSDAQAQDNVTSSEQAVGGVPTASAPTNALMVSCFATGKVQQVLLATALVRARANNGEGHTIRALLDQGSQASFITQSTAQCLGLRKTKTTSRITGLGGDKSIVSKATVELEIQSRMDPKVRFAVKAHVIKSITSLLPSKGMEAIEWQELQDLALADPEYYVPNKINILLGAEIYTRILQHGLKKGPQGSVIAQATSLGWILSGVVDAPNNTALPIRVMHCRSVDDDSLLKKFWEMEAEVQQPKEMMFTEEEKQCEQHFKETTVRDENGRYVVCLPFNKSPPVVTASLEIAEKRFKSLEFKLDKDKTLKSEYQKVINDYLVLGHMERVPHQDIGNSDAIYLPHHAVIRTDKQTTKVRVVFDASCKGRNQLSLNDHLLTGPTLQPELRHIIMQWRAPPICMSADIVKMYRQIRTAAQDSDYQRILWRDDRTSELEHYRLTRVTFGTASAPYLAVKTLQQVAHDHGADYPHAAEKVLKNFYVDDLMTGVQTEEEGIKVFQEMTELLSKAGFELQKWNSNSNSLLEVMNPNKNEQKAEKALNIRQDELVKIMGLTWNQNDDTFRYVINLPILQEPITKRKIISDISRLFDPLGWVGPSIIIAKIMIQKLWLAGIDWDEKVPDNILQEWMSYREAQVMLSNIRIPRWLGTRAGDTVVELQGFCDASKLAFAAVVYVRTVDSEGKVNVSLLTAKTKVAPVKQVSIPRLELCGAVLLCKLLLEAARVMNIEKRYIHAWTDSTVVLAWLNKHPSKWNVFVANRVSEILTNMDPQNWSHVSSKENPADCASRGLHPAELASSSLWFHGPDFLSQETVNYIKLKETETDLEAAKVKVHCAMQEDPMWNKYSSLTKTVRVIAYCKRFISNSRKTSATDRETGYLKAKEIARALTTVVKLCQEEHFGKKGQMPDKSNKVHMKSLNPYLDQEGVLRVGGRLEHSSLSFDRKHPILIPKRSHLTDLIISDAHKMTLHGGPQLMLSYLLSKYWVIGAKQLVRATYRKCVTCTKQACATSSPLMGQLPTQRVTPARAFLHSGVDYAGPIQIRTAKGRGQRSYKGYICLFVCMSTRAVHLECVTDLTSEGFLQTYKRFVARRGRCSHLWSDNGTNFIGAAADMQRRSTAEMKSVQLEVAQQLASNDCEWHFMPPHSPNFGGLWEAGVKSVKHHLRRVVGNSTLTYEELATVLCQVEACLNSRPMSVIDDKDVSFTVLTPGHFLIGEPLLTAPDHNMDSIGVHSLRRWQLTQKMVQGFWRLWSQEYLTKFFHRYKWAKHEPQPNVGDVVVVKEDNIPPSRWLYGRIVATHAGDDLVTRVVTLQTKTGLLKRPVSKLCLLPVAKD